MRLHEGRVIEQLAVRGGRLRFTPCSAWPRVALLTATLGDDGRLAKLLPEAGYDGCVVAGVGGGHVPAVMVESLEALALRMPVVLASRIATGSVFERTYGYPGGERDLLARGLISGGWLGALKARILLTLCLATAGPKAAAQFACALKTLSSPPSACSERT
jgi:L-asparaginase